MSHIDDRETVAEEKFLRLEKIHFTDNRKRKRIWEAVNRRGTNGAVILAVTFEPSGDLLLVRQFRPPAGALTVEMPAGLIDPGETPEQAAVRELYEETGYTGKIVKVYPPAINSPGLSGEASILVRMTVAEADYPEIPENHQEDTEDIECLRVARRDLGSFLLERIAAGEQIDTKLFYLNLL